MRSDLERAILELSVRIFVIIHLLSFILFILLLIREPELLRESRLNHYNIHVSDATMSTLDQAAVVPDFFLACRAARIASILRFNACLQAEGKMW